MERMDITDHHVKPTAKANTGSTAANVDAEQDAVTLDQVEFNESGRIAEHSQALIDPADGTLIDPTDGTLIEPTDCTIIDPTDGTLIDPTDGTVIDPTDGSMIDPIDGTIIQPTVATINDPSDEPMTDEPMDESLIDPRDGSIIDPTDGTILDPTDANVDPADGTLIDPADGLIEDADGIIYQDEDGDEELGSDLDEALDGEDIGDEDIEDGDVDDEGDDEVDEEEDEADDEAEPTTTVDLGFLSECEPYLLTNRYFPSKVGGKPAWLDLTNLPTVDQMKCRKCGEVMVFLLQVYASEEEVEHAFHRMLYVFVCKQTDCWVPNCTKHISVFRCQLPQKNPFYSIEFPDDTARLEAAPTTVNLCALCGIRGPFNCSKCKTTNYCSASHQKIDWLNGHKELCKSGTTQSSAGVIQFVLRELELDIEPEYSDDLPGSETEEQAEERRTREAKRIEDGSEFGGEMADVSAEELLKYTGDTENSEDPVFNEFRRRTAATKFQVLRYDRCGEPLWVCSMGQLNAEDVPKCELCGSERDFEFQIMPQLLNSMPKEPFDWGTLVVYTCSANCKAKDAKGYVLEFCHKQDMQ